MCYRNVWRLGPESGIKGPESSQRLPAGAATSEKNERKIKKLRERYKREICKDIVRKRGRVIFVF